jgi:Flp pilus assembly protein TadB
MQTMQKKQSEIRRAELAEYAQQMKLEVRSGKLCPQSISEIMGQLDEPLADSSQ